jgi:AbrB family looped-hinge helix DNA binding protein
MMATSTATVTSKGQVTIPVEVRRRLGIAPSDKIVFVYDESGPVVVRKMKFSVEDLQGILPILPVAPSPDFEEEIHQAFEAGFDDDSGDGSQK